MGPQVGAFGKPSINAQYREKTSNKLGSRVVPKLNLDPANFSRKVLNILGFVEAIPGAKRVDTNGRPAQLYRRGTATRLMPELRLSVKRSKPKC